MKSGRSINFKSLSFLLTVLWVSAYTFYNWSFVNTALIRVGDFSNDWINSFTRQHYLHLSANKTAKIRSKLNTTIPIFWTNSTKKINLNAAKWWLKFYRHDKYVNKTLTDLLFKILNNNGFKDKESVYRKYEYLKETIYLSCAVVGNSDTILNTNHGQVIDMHEAVFRFNLGLLRGYEDDVGRKTTHHFAYPESFRDSLFSNDTTFVFTPYKMLDMKWLVAQTTDVILQDHKKLPHYSKNTPYPRLGNIWILHPEFIHYVQKTWVNNERKIPSTGIIGVVLALHICEDVSVFGFGENRDGYWAHYSGDTKVLSNETNHDPTMEMDLILQLHKEHVIRYYSKRAEAWWI